MKYILTRCDDTQAFLKECETSLPNLVIRDDNGVAVGVSLDKTATYRSGNLTVSAVACDDETLATLKGMTSIKVLVESTDVDVDLYAKMTAAKKALFDAVYNPQPTTVNGQTVEPMLIDWATPFA